VQRLGVVVVAVDRSTTHVGDSRVFLHPTSHLVHHDCLRDGEAQAKRARTEAEQRLPSFTCELVGQFSQAMCAKDCVGLIRQGDVVVVELPQRCNGGRTMAWEDLQQLSSEARRVGARLHMDGARLWEVQPYYDRPLHDICALFDSVYVSFYKGLGGMSGAMLCSDAATMAGSRDFRTRLGGSVMALAPIWLDAREQFQSCMQEGFSMRFKKLQEVVRALSADSAIRSIMCFEPAEPQACLIHVYLSGTQTKLDAAHAQVKQATGRTLWNSLRGCGYQVPARAASADGATEQTYFEWNMGPANSKIPTADFVEAWQAFARALAEEP